MKVVILAGGLGTRINETGHLNPKPMTEVGDKPIIWHIMKLYSFYGYNEFIICCGYKQHMIKEWFADYYLYNSDITFNFAKQNEMIVHNNVSEPWKVTLVDTGLNTMTGGRIKRVQKYIGTETFMVTYGDGVSNLNVSELVKFHKNHGKIGTLTAVNVDQRFGILDVNEQGRVNAFREKQAGDANLINGGFMVFEPGIFDYLMSDQTTLEKEPLERLAADGELKAYRHIGFWKCMDTQRDRMELERLWRENKAQWKVWE
ncbi:glucose-1-phosphate cytidylyltransferase [Lachnospiraceae bacterium]|nr:glucose-1-phosphate cytidylyltransferase [Lachnospiraceae bacterium]